MPYYEIIYETGNSSLAMYEDDEEMQRALSEHHRRAISGEPGTSQSTLRTDLPAGETRVGSWAAERVKKVYVYDEHPADYGADQLANVGELRERFDEIVAASEMNGVVHVGTVAAALRDISSPLKAEVASRHDSQYKMQEAREADLSFLKAVEE